MERHLHIISFDVPFPANYGGVIDVYYKLVALKEQGVKVTLHCFTYGRSEALELDKLCEQVHYYPRKTGLLANLSLMPYTAKSRQSKALEDNLLKDDHPVLFEVLHTCYLLNDPRFKSRKKIYRHSNIEHDYYRELSKSERNILKKIFLKVEAWKLKRFESILRFADLILAVNQKDTAYFLEKYPRVKTLYLPSFHPQDRVSIQLGKGDYILFQGNLSVSENYEAAIWIVEQVFSKLEFKCVIAGLNPPDFLRELIQKYDHIELIANPGHAHMNQLIQAAQVHVLYTAQPTGLKLKLLNVLFKGRFVVCNPNMVSGTDLMQNGTLRLCSTGPQYIAHITSCMAADFTLGDAEERAKLVVPFDNAVNAEKLIGVVFLS